MKTLLLDRDGLLIRDMGYDFTPEDIELLPNVIAGLTRFRDAGWRFFIITNQGVIGRGIQTAAQYEVCRQLTEDLLAAENIIIERTYHCPHDPADACRCRKPATGMWEQLHRDFPEVVAADSVMAGDKDTDVLFGKAIGAKTARVPSRYPSDEIADYAVEDLNALADILLT